MDALLDKSLRRSQQFASIYDSDGQSYVFEFAQPENNRRLSEMERALLEWFPGDRFLPVPEGIATYLRHRGISADSEVSDSLLAAVARFIKLGVLVEGTGPSGPYSTEMCASYARSRQVPPEIAATIAGAVNLDRAAGVLDLGCGTGSLAIRLGMISADVTGADISHDFIEIARAGARAQGSHASFVRLDGNRLLFSRRSYDVIAASQILHWLDPALAVRGINRALHSEGSLFAIETKAVLWAGHPLRRLLGFGNLRRSTVLHECMRHARANVDLFACLAPRLPGFALKGMWIFRQSRIFDIEFARAFFFPGQLQAAFPNHRSPHDALREQLAAVPAQHAGGDFYWLLLQFTKLASSHSQRHSGRIAPHEVIDIPYNPD